MDENKNRQKNSCLGSHVEENCCVCFWPDWHARVCCPIVFDILAELVSWTCNLFGKIGLRPSKVWEITCKKFLNYQPNSDSLKAAKTYSKWFLSCLIFYVFMSVDRLWAALTIVVNSDNHPVVLSIGFE